MKNRKQITRFLAILIIGLVLGSGVVSAEYLGWTGLKPRLYLKPVSMGYGRIASQLILL